MVSAWQTHREHCLRDRVLYKLDSLRQKIWMGPMNINEILNLTTEGQRHWMEQQGWYKCTEFEGELHNASPFLDIFESIPALWDDRFIYDLLHDSTLVSEDRFIGIQSGLSLTDIEVDEIREKLVQSELDAFNSLEARKMEFESFDETFIAVFVGGAERRCDWDPEFIGLYRSIEEAEKKIYSLYKKYYVTDKYVPDRY